VLTKALLEDRAHMMAAARSFFATRGVMEVDVPILTQGASIDAHIDLMPATYKRKDIRHLHSSPEHGMKRLLAHGSGDIYQLSHVFRDGELGARHNPEFMMVEWYRVGLPYETLIEETLDFIRLFVGPLPVEHLTYAEAFQRYLNLDYMKVTLADLDRPYLGLEKEDHDALLNVYVGTYIEPNLGKEGLTVLKAYPASQASLAKTQQDAQGRPIAERFEVYYKGLELCNGYHELTDPHEQRVRFEEANAYRLRLGKQPLPLDELFIKSLHKGMPDTCGVAVGFDRLMMLRHQAHSISQILPFPWAFA